jgi:flagellar biosynthesis protein FliP
LKLLGVSDAACPPCQRSEHADADHHLMTLLTLLPAIVMSITPFLRISIVLHFLRQALGTQTRPRIRCWWGFRFS